MSKNAIVWFDSLKKCFQLWPLRTKIFSEVDTFPGGVTFLFGFCAVFPRQPRVARDEVSKRSYGADQDCAGRSSVQPDVILWFGLVWVWWAGVSCYMQVGQQFGLLRFKKRGRSRKLVPTMSSRVSASRTTKTENHHSRLAPSLVNICNYFSRFDPTKISPLCADQRSPWITHSSQGDRNMQRLSHCCAVFVYDRQHITALCRRDAA